MTNSLITNLKEARQALGIESSQKLNAYNWWTISRYVHLSEAFIERYADKVDWYCISEYQRLSETFIERYADKVNWFNISRYQHLSKSFRKKHDIPMPNDNYMAWTTRQKKNAVVKTGLYECHEDYFIAYKGIQQNRYSKLNFQYQYLPGETYTTHADYTNEENSYGFSAWTKENAQDYCSELVVKVKIYYEDVARVVHNGGKIRCCRMTVLS